METTSSLAGSQTPILLESRSITERDLLIP
jgi:hypothetical protein